MYKLGDRVLVQFNPGGEQWDGIIRSGKGFVTTRYLVELTRKRVDGGEDPNSLIYFNVESIKYEPKWYREQRLKKILDEKKL